MQTEKIQELVTGQHHFFASGATLDVNTRLQYLRKLRAAIRSHEAELNEALRKDLGKSASESYMCEVGLALSELTHMLRHTRRYAAEKRVPTPLAQYVSRSFVKPSPCGTVLIMSPWNYPVLLTLDPLIDAVAAGNTAVVKPSAYSPASGAVLAEMIGEVFPKEYAAVITGGRAENQALLDQPFDKIFFTGSQAVGREVLRHAAERLTPAVLELGGKSPCVVDESANLSLAARRIVWGKFLNCGQTCVAPDYILCQESVKPALLEALVREIRRQFGADPLKRVSYGHIVSEKHFDRLMGLIDPAKVIFGGRNDRSALRIEPTVLDGVTWEDAVMQEEIFGPVLPVLTYEKIGDVPAMLADRPKPLALYIFSENRAHCRMLTEVCRFGGGCINDTVIHLATSAMGFGGVGESGMGSYHGRRGFEAFSHRKSIVDKKTWMDLPMRYQPYTALHDRLIRMFIH